MTPRHLHSWRTLVAAVGCVTALSLLVAGCGGSSSTGSNQPTATTGAGNPTSAPSTATSGGGSGAATIAMGAGHFSGNTAVTIKAGQSVLFDDSAGGAHNLVIGMHGVFSAENGAPSQLNNKTGVNFGGGDQQTIAFPTAGTYNITCTFHPSMQATVTVTQ